MLWYHPAPVTRSLIACDFDGTITRRDTLHLIVDRYGDPAMWDRLDGPLTRGEVTVEQAIEREFATVRATTQEALELCRAEAGVREGFTEFVDWARREGHRIVVMSNGFRTIIDDLLGRIGMGDLPVVCHDIAFRPEGARVLWADRGERCTLCGRRCKRAELSAVRGDDRVVYLGDGISDRCGARMADLVFARHDLARDLAEDGVPFVPFEDFVEVRERLDARAALAA